VIEMSSSTSTGWSKFRVSSQVAARSSAILLASVCAMVASAAVLNRLLHGAWDVNWQVPLEFGSVLAAVWYWAVFLSTRTDLQRHGAEAVGGARVFAAIKPVQILLIVAAGFSVGLTWVFRRENLPAAVDFERQHYPHWIQLLTAAVAFLAFYLWPHAIRCDAGGITQRTRLGRTKRIPYSAVESVAVSDGVTTVKGAGRTIRHSGIYEGPEEFQKLLTERTRKPVELVERGTGNERIPS